jgi:DNA-binding NtrC family response regulator
MENQVTESALATDLRSAYADPETAEQPEVRQLPPLEALRIPVGTNLADVERWMIFATLQKCSGNKTRAAALLGVSLKTLYNRLNAYRAQGLAMDYDLADDSGAALDALPGEESGHARGNDLPDEYT